MFSKKFRVRRIDPAIFRYRYWYGVMHSCEDDHGIGSHSFRDAVYLCLNYDSYMIAKVDPRDDFCYAEYVRGVDFDDHDSDPGYLAHLAELREFFYS